MILKKGQDVIAIEILDADETILVPTDDRLAVQLIECLEQLIGAPALDDYGPASTSFDKIVVSRYYLKHDEDLIDED